MFCILTNLQWFWLLAHLPCQIFCNASSLKINIYLTPDWTLWVSYSLSDAARALVWAQMISTIPLEILSIQIWLINWFTNSLCWPIWAPICSTAGKLNVYIWHLEKFLWHDINTLSNKIRILQISSNTSLGHLEWISGIDYTRIKMIVHGQKQGCFGLKSW